MRNKFKRVATILLVALMLAGFTLPAAPAALAQGTSTITFAGMPLTGSQEEMAAFVLQTLRPAVAAADPSQLTDTSSLKPFTPTNGCFGVTEKKGDWRLLRETRYMTDLSNGRYEAIVPPGDGHGDWPPHGLLFDIKTSEVLGCQVLVADISYRMLFVPPKDTTLVYSFKLNPEQKDAYAALASQGDLGLFVASETPVEVNLELLAGRACHDCLAFTRATTTTVGAGIYTPDTVEWFGTLTEDDNVPLDEMYVLPIPEDYTKEWNVTIAAPANSVVWIWFGRFDMPE